MPVLADPVESTMLSRDLSAHIFKALHNPLRAQWACAYSATCRDLWQWLLEAREALRYQSHSARCFSVRLLLTPPGPHPLGFALSDCVACAARTRSCGT